MLPPSHDFLEAIEMFGIGDRKYGWLDCKPDPDNWPLLESIHFRDECGGRVPPSAPT